MDCQTGHLLEGGNDYGCVWSRAGIGVLLVVVLARSGNPSAGAIMPNNENRERCRPCPFSYLIPYLIPSLCPLLPFSPLEGLIFLHYIAY